MRRTIVLALLALLALPAGAAAKELSAVTVCPQPASCRTVQDAAAAEALADRSLPAAAPKVRERLVPVTLEVSHEGEHAGTVPLMWAPRAGLLRGLGDEGQDAWYEPSAPARRWLARMTAPPPAPAPARAERSDGAEPWALGGAALVVLAGAALALYRRRGALLQGLRPGT